MVDIYSFAHQPQDGSLTHLKHYLYYLHDMILSLILCLLLARVLIKIVIITHLIFYIICISEKTDRKL